MTMLGGLPQPCVSLETAARTRDYNIDLMLQAVRRGLPTLARDAARSAAHFGRLAGALGSLDPALARLARFEAAKTLPGPALEEPLFAEPEPEETGFEVIS